MFITDRRVGQDDVDVVVVKRLKLSGKPIAGPVRQGHTEFMPRRVDKNAKRMEIVRAATQVFGRDGYASAKMADVAAVAGIGKGTIYEYFPSKEELFLAMCRELVRWPEDVTPFITEPVQGLRDLIKAIVASYERATEFFNILIDYWAVIIRDKNAKVELFLSQGESFYDKPRRLVAGVISAGQARGAFAPSLDPAKTAQIIIAAIEGLRIQGVLDPGNVRLDSDVGALSEFLIRSVVA